MVPAPGDHDRYAPPPMSIDPRTPVLVGAGVRTPRDDDPTALPDAVGLMTEAVLAAADDAGSRALVAAADQVAVPRGTWPQADPGRLVADRVGATGAATMVVEVGVLQQDLFTDACTRIARGQLDVAVVVGGEAKHRAGRARALGIEVPESPEHEGARPDRVVAAASLGVHDLEIMRHAVTPATSYALIDHARMHALGRTPDEHRGALGELWAGLAAVAAANPHAWDRRGLTAEEITTPGPGNRLIATPYPKLLCSQWNVDQAAALVVCSAGVAERFGVPRDRWVFPWSAASSDHAVPVLQRALLGEAPGADLTVSAVLDLAGVRAVDVAVRDLYSCFPAAVQVLADALGGSTPGAAVVPATVTGGMTFAGGPLNNYVLQALAAMVPRLREDPEAIGLSTSVSGFLVKQGAGLWSASPPPRGYQAADVTARTAAAMAGDATRPVAGDHDGPARVASWTVAHDPVGGIRGVAVCDVPGGARTLASTDDPGACAALAEGDWIGQPVVVTADGALHLP